MAYSGPNILATGSYDGDIIIWNLGSEQVSKRLNQRSRRIIMKSQGKGNMGSLSREVPVFYCREVPIFYCREVPVFYCRERKL